MKKLLLVAFLMISTTTFSQEEAQAEINKSYHRFGINVATLGVGYGLNLSVFPLSFYVANDLQQIISFGFDLGFSVVAGPQMGGHIGFGKMKPSSYNPRLHLGYLIEFSIGYSAYAPFLPGMYIGFSPSFILEIDQFLFRTGIYLDTSATITATVGLGFLLK